MAKKDTTTAVLAMLGERGAGFRPTGDPAPEPRSAPVEEPEPASHSPVSPAPPAKVQSPLPPTARRARKQSPKTAVKPDPAENAPRTLRLSQPMATALREAWLAAKREDVLLTYQDFADQVVRAGLRRR